MKKNEIDILVVEDNPGDFRLVAEMLKESINPFFTIRHTESCAESIKLLETDRVDVVLLDLGLPDSNGLYCMESILSLNPMLPIIILTGRDDENIGIEALQKNAADYLVKGQINEILLVRSIRYAIQRKRAEEELARARANLEVQVEERTKELNRMNEDLQLEIITCSLAEDKLRETGKMLETIFSTTHISIVYLDKDFNYVRVNHAFAEETGRDESFFVGKNHFALFRDEDNEAIFRKAIDTGETLSGFARPYNFIEIPERGITYWDWTITPVKDDEGSVKEIIFIMVNVTDRILSHKRIQESEARLAKAQSIAHLGYWELNLITNELFWSQEIYNIFGRNSDVFIPTYETFLNCVHPEDRGTVIRVVDEAILNQIPFNIDHRVMIPDGEVRYVNEQGEVAYDIKGKAIYIIGTILDITPLKISEQRKTEAIQLAEQSARLASIGAVTGGITHEINQPLNAIKVSVDGILYWYKNNRVLVPEPFISMLQKISASVERINEIIKHMRTFWAAQDHVVREDFNMNDVVVKALSLIMQQLSAHGIKTLTELCNEAPFIKGNPIHIEQIVINLVTNSMHALDEVSGKDKTIVVKTLMEDHSVKLMVIDNGMGIPPGVDDRLFDPFYSSRKPAEGTGLGLAIVKRFVEEYRGSITHYNNPSGGAIFSLQFPLTEYKG
jgi:PAS domain S-box-containing protein